MSGPEARDALICIEDGPMVLTTGWAQAQAVSLLLADLEWGSEGSAHGQRVGQSVWCAVHADSEL
jgi:hypothetical protein